MQPFTLLIKPSGSDCNINCRYCFYKDRFPLSDAGGQQRMTPDVLEKLVKDYMQTGFDVVGFAWQGGEPTLMGLDFFAGAVELQKKYGRPGQWISNTLQTNGVLLDDNWCGFFRKNRFLLGISIDGPREFHDRYRLDYAGSGTFDRVIRGIRACRKHEVEFSALILLNNINVEHPDRLFEFILENDLAFLQFIPCVEQDPATGGLTDFSITPRQYGDFLCRLFDLWYDYGPEKLNIRDFDSILTYYVMGRHTICTYSDRCLGFVVIEHTGEAFCCEFFVEPRWRLGNILDTPLAELAAAPKLKEFARTKQNLAAKCTLCKYLSLCRGGCLKDRLRFADDPAQPSYFCEGYRQFFDHAVPKFMQLAAATEQGLAGRRTRSAHKVRLRIPK